MCNREQLDAHVALVHWRDDADRAGFLQQEARRLAAELDAALERVSELETAIDEYLQPSSRRRKPNRLLMARQAPGGQTAEDATGGAQDGPGAL
jgi:protein subunit release factor A